jgi:hypothetical protein
VEGGAPLSQNTRKHALSLRSREWERVPGRRVREEKKATLLFVKLMDIRGSLLGKVHVFPAIFPKLVLFSLLFYHENHV